MGSPLRWRRRGRRALPAARYWAGQVPGSYDYTPRSLWPQHVRKGTGSLVPGCGSQSQQFFGALALATRG